MGLSQIRFIDGSYQVRNCELTLVIEPISGSVMRGDGIPVFGSIWTITDIHHTAIKNRYEVVAVSNTIYVNDLDLEIYDLRGTEIACGLSIESFKLKSPQEKIEYLMQLAELNPFKPIAKFIREHLQLCIAVFPVSNAVITGLSKIGGVPVAPAHFTYPTDKNGKSTLFLAQIHLDEFNQWCETTRQLNGRGILYFFGSIRISNEIYYSFDEIIVRYSDQTDNLVQIPFPADIEEYGSFEEKDMAVIDEISLPSDDSTFTDDARLEESELALYKEFEDLVRLYNYVDPPEGGYYDGIRLLGYPQQIQGCVLMETVLKQRKQGWYHPEKSQWNKFPEPGSGIFEEALQWRHLFSFPPDPWSKLSKFEGEFNKYKDGMFNVMIKEKDLADLNFDNTESIYQFT